MKAKIALFFTLLFVGIVVTPTVITFLDESQDISIFFSLSEEEENHGKKTFKEIKIHPTYNNFYVFYKILQKKKNVRFKSKNYISEYPKITTPPPEFVTFLS